MRWNVELGFENGKIAVKAISVAAEPHGQVLAALEWLEIHGSS
jgi:hypothetical protein